MQKFERYLGLLVCLVMLLLFMPGNMPGNSHLTDKARLTPFDNSIIVILATMNNDKFRFWNEGTHFYNVCAINDSCENFAEYIDIGAFLSQIYPMMRFNSKLRDLHDRAYQEGWHFGDENQKAFFKEASIASLIHLEAMKLELQLKTYFLLLLFSLSIFFVFKDRELVGYVVLIPFRLVKKGLFKGAEAAKELHDKV